MVAELAMSMLSDATRVKVERVLGGMTAAEAGNWMDEVRSDQQYKYTAPWHYVNIESGGAYKPAPSGDIVTTLNKAYTGLQHPEKLSPEQVKFDVLVLFHLCGDLLQPLHVGYGSDKGGNTYQVNYNGKGTNLHHLWDSELIEAEIITLAGDVQPKAKILFNKNLRKHITDKVDFMQYFMMSRDKLDVVYNLPGHIPFSAYTKKSRIVVINELSYAAILLTNRLESALSFVMNIPVHHYCSIIQPEGCSPW